MPAPDETAAIVTLMRGGSARGLADRIEYEGSARALLDGQTPALFGDGDALADARADLERWAADGFEVVTVLDERYPANLDAVHDRPPLLFVAGELRGDDDRAIAVVGTRSAGEQGQALAGEVAARAAEAGFTVVSGLAAGIDAAAHRGAIDAGGRTVAVLGTGLRHSYPRQNAGLQRQIAADHAVVSQFWPDQPPQRHTFPLRNATISGLSLATVLVEVSTTGGSRIQAELALAQGRPLFLLPPVLDQPWGRELAERPGVLVVDTPEALAERLEALAAPDVALVP